MRLEERRRALADDATVGRRSVGEELSLGRRGLDGQLLCRVWSGWSDSSSEERSVGGSAFGERVDDLTSRARVSKRASLVAQQSTRGHLLEALVVAEEAAPPGEAVLSKDLLLEGLAKLHPGVLRVGSEAGLP